MHFGLDLFLSLTFRGQRRIRKKAQKSGKQVVRISLNCRLYGSPIIYFLSEYKIKNRKKGNDLNKRKYLASILF